MKVIRIMRAEKSDMFYAPSYGRKVVVVNYGGVGTDPQDPSVFIPESDYDPSDRKVKVEYDLPQEHFSELFDAAKRHNRNEVFRLIELYFD